MGRTVEHRSGRLHQLRALLLPGNGVVVAGPHATRLAARRFRWLVLSIAAVTMLAATTLRFHDLAAKSISLEEAVTFVAATQPLESIVEWPWSNSGSPPIFYLLTHLSLRLVGDNDLALRLPATLSGILLVAAVGWAALRLFGPKAAVLSLLLIALSPVGIHLSQDARPFSLVMLLATISSVALWEAARGRGVAWWVLFVLATTTSIYTTYLALVLLCAQLVFIVIGFIKQPQGHQRRRWVLLGSAMLVLAVLSLPQLWAAYRSLESSLGTSAVVSTTLLDVLPTSFARNLAPALAFWNWIHFFGRTWLAVAWVIFLLIAIEESTWTADRRWATFYAISLIASPLLLFFLNPVAIVQRDHLLLVFPFYLLLVARGIQLSMERIAALLPAKPLAQSWRGALWSGAILALALLHVVPLEEYYRSQPGNAHDKPDYRGAAAYLEQAWQPGELLVAGTDSTWTAMHRYLPLIPPLSNQAIRSLVESGRGGYLVDDASAPRSPGYVDYVPRDPHWMARHLVLVQERPGVRVYRFGSATATGAPYIQIDLADSRSRAQHLHPLPFRQSGWSVDTYHLSGRDWAITSGNHSGVRVVLRPDTSYLMSFQVRPFRLTDHHLSVRLNGQLLYTTYLPQGESQHELVIPVGFAHAGLNTIEIEHATEELGQEEPRLIGTTGVEAPVDVSVRSVSSNRGNFSSIHVNGRRYSDELQGDGYDRGYTVVVLDEAGKVEQTEAFDTFASSADSQSMAQFISTIPEGRIVIMSTRDEASASLTEDAIAAVRSIGGAEDLRGRFRWMHSLVGVKGAEPGTALEQARSTETLLILGKDPQEQALLIDRIILAPADRTSLLFGSNWREAEPNHRWATSPASLKIISSHDQSATLIIRASALHDPASTSGIGTQGVLHVQVEGRHATTINVTAGQASAIPLDLRQGDQTVTLSLAAGNFRPADYGGVDPSVLSFAIESIELLLEDAD
jgi:4-amino-4-deoxy-L-arabinose transferase-like glycosyltransferase